MDLTGKRIQVTRGIDAAQFTSLKALTALYEELQLCTVEAGFPGEDMFTFSSRTALFGVINLKGYVPLPQHHDVDEWEKWEEPSNSPGHPIGILYLMPTQQPPYPPGSIGELSLGIILQQQHRGMGYARETLALILEEAFRNMDCHRINVNLLDTSSREKAMSLFISMRFCHEGKRRRSFFSILEQEWKDTTSLAILDTDWMVRSKFLTKAAPTTLWDEMLSRHDRERQQLMRWEDDQTQSWPKWLKRTSSMETIRMSMAPVSDVSKDSSDEYESAAPSDIEGTSSSSRLPGGSGLGNLTLEGSPSSRFLIKRKGKGKRNIDSAASPSDPFADYPSSDSEFENDTAYPPRKSLRFGSPTEESDFAIGHTTAFNHSFSLNYPPLPRAYSSTPSPPASVATAPSPSPSPQSASDFITARSRSRSRSRSSSLSLESASDSQSDAGASDNDGYASSTPSSSSQWDLLETRSASPSESPFLDIDEEEIYELM